MEISRKTKVMMPSLYLECSFLSISSFFFFFFQHWGWNPESPTQELMFSPMFAAERLRINWDLWTVTWKGACHVPQGVALVYPLIGQHSSCFRVLLSTGPKEALHPTPPHVSHGFAITKPWVATFLSFGLCMHICIGACTCGGEWWFPYHSSLHILRQGLQEPGAHW